MGSVLQGLGGPEIQVLPRSNFRLLKKEFFLGCFLKDVSFEDQRVVSVVVVAVVRKRSRQIHFKDLMKQPVKCPSPVGKNETGSLVWLLLRCSLHLLCISFLAFTSSLVCYPLCPSIYYWLSLLSVLDIIISSKSLLCGGAAHCSLHWQLIFWTRWSWRSLPAFVILYSNTWSKLFLTIAMEFPYQKPKEILTQAY